MTMACLVAGLTWRVSWLLVPFTIALGIFIGGELIAPLVDGPPVTVLKTQVLEDRLRAGDALRFLITTVPRSDRQCIGYVTREFQRRIRIGDDWLWEKRRAATIAPPIPDAAEDVGPDGKARYVIVVPIPEDATPGEWRFKGRTTYDCGFWLGGIRNYDTPPLYFRVVAN